MNLSDFVILILSGLIAFGTSYAMVKVTHKSEIKRIVFESRLRIYSEGFFHFERLTNNPTLVFNDAFFRKFAEIKAKIKLIASKNVSSSFSEIYNTYAVINNEYNDILSNIPDDNISDKKKASREYIEQNKFSRDDSAKLLAPLIKNMRSDLGQVD